MALSGRGFVAVRNWYHGVRTTETNSAVVEVHRGDAAVRRTRPVKFTAMVERKEKNDNVYHYKMSTWQLCFFLIVLFWVYFLFEDFNSACKNKMGL